MNYAVSIRQRLDRPRHFDGYQISIEPTNEAANDELVAHSTVYNNTQATSGVFGSLSDALAAIYRAIDLPFSVHQNAGSAYADHTVMPIDAQPTAYSRRLATVRRNGGVVMYDAE